MIIYGKKHRKKFSTIEFFRGIFSSIGSIIIWLLSMLVGSVVSLLVFLLAPIGGGETAYQRYFSKQPFENLIIITGVALLLFGLYVLRRGKKSLHLDRGNLIERRRVPFIHVLNSLILTAGVYSLNRYLITALGRLKFGDFTAQIESFRQLMERGFDGSQIFLYIVLLLIIPILGSLLVPGILMGELRNRVPFFISYIIIAAVFAVIHRYVVYMIAAFIFGFIIAIVYRITRNIFVPILMMVLYNALTIVPFAFRYLIGQYLFGIRIAGYITIGLGFISLLFLLRYQSKVKQLYHRIIVE